MKYRNILFLQKILYFNVYIFLVWIGVVSFFLYMKLGILGHLTKYLTLTVFALLIIIELTRLYLGHYGNLTCQVPELAGFLMLTTLMQLPLISFFVFNPYLLSTPTELILHGILWVFSIFEVVFSFLALRQASSIAKSIYLQHCND